MADEVKKPATAPAAAGTAAAAPKPKAEPKPPRYHPEGTITLLADPKDATKKYGTGEGLVNPKRAGTKAHAAFANYKDGMKIADLAKAFEKTGGSMNANLDWDIEHNFVKYNAPAKTA